MNVNYLYKLWNIHICSIRENPLNSLLWLYVEIPLTISIWRWSLFGMGGSLAVCLTLGRCIHTTGFVFSTSWLPCSEHFCSAMKFLPWSEVAVDWIHCNVKPNKPLLVSVGYFVPETGKLASKHLKWSGSFICWFLLIPY